MSLVAIQTKAVMQVRASRGTYNGRALLRATAIGVGTAGAGRAELLEEEEVDGAGDGEVGGDGANEELKVGPDFGDAKGPCGVSWA